MDTRYTPYPGRFFTVTQNCFDSTHDTVDHIFLCLTWDGPRVRAYNLTNACHYRMDVRDADFAPLSDAEVVKRLAEVAA